MDGRAGRISLLRHQRPRRLPFVLTPLIDVMFLLLIFFMLSSRLSTYSVLTVGQVSDAAAGAGAAAETPATVSDLAIRVSSGAASIGGQAISLNEIRPALEQLIAQGVNGFIVTATRRASVQDMVTVLESLRAVSAARVTLVTADGGGEGR